MAEKTRSLLGLIGDADDSDTEIVKTHEEGNGDAAIREVLAEHGDDGTRARHTLLYLYGGDQAGLRVAARASGYTVSLIEETNGSVLETTTSVDAASFEPVRLQMEAWATQFGATFDGWECAVEPSLH